MTPPDYIVIGAMKCGTSTLATQLGAQDGIFMTTPKEPNYFSDDAVFARGSEWYSALFDEAGKDDVRGEASTHYTKLPTYPDTVARLKEAAPHVRLVYMIRNPIERVVSHYIHAWSEGETSDPIETAFATMPELVDYGRYGWQIAPFVEAFGADAILLTSLERQRQAADAELARIAAHLGFCGPVAWQHDLGIQNVSSQRIRKLPFHGLLIDNPFSTALRRALVPASLRRRIRESRQMDVRPALPETALNDIKNRFAADRELLSRYFPGDPSLELAYPFLSQPDAPTAT